LILVPPELWEKRCKTPSPPPVKIILKVKIIAIINGFVFVCMKTCTRKLKNKKRDPLPIAIEETKRRSGPYIKAEKLQIEIKTNSQPVQSTYITC